VLERLAQAPRDRYPDPDYLRVRRDLADFHGVDPERIVPGSGASELIHRLVGLHPGIVLTMQRTFVEYRRSASIWNRDTLQARSEAEFLRWLPLSAIAFLCHPNNPDGILHAPAFLEEAARTAEASGTILVLDLAYQSILDDHAPQLPSRATHLYAPNKPLDCAGVRAAYLVAPTKEQGTAWRSHAPSWVVGSEGVALLEAWCSPEVASWLSGKRHQVRRLVTCLGSLLADAGWSVQATSANFLLARPPRAESALALERSGLRLRDATNMGYPGWYRLAARPIRELVSLRDALRTEV